MNLMNLWKKIFKPNPLISPLVGYDLLSMRLILSKEKWCKGWMNLGEAHCLYGAWYSLDKKSDNTIKLLAYNIRQKNSSYNNISDVLTITRWNDRNDTTYEDVVNLLNETIKQVNP